MRYLDYHLAVQGAVAFRKEFFVLLESVYDSFSQYGEEEEACCINKTDRYCVILKNKILCCGFIKFVKTANKFCNCKRQ